MINLKDIFKSYNIDLSDKQYQQFQNYQKYFPETKVYGFDYKSNYPWEAKEEFYKEIS